MEISSPNLGDSGGLAGHARRALESLEELLISHLEVVRVCLPLPPSLFNDNFRIC